MTTSSSLYPWLLADIGGTNARFALECAPNQLQHIAILATADYPDIVSAIHAYLAQTGNLNPQYAAIAIANPVRSDGIEMTNHAWSFSIEATRTALGLERLLVINDFTALARSLPYLSAADVEQIGGVASSSTPQVMGLLGAGTGLGVSALIPAEQRWVSLDSEGGHVSFAPNTALERSILEILAQAFAPHPISAERLLSGPGLSNCYRALVQINGIDQAPHLTPAQVVEQAKAAHLATLSTPNPVAQTCLQTMQVFSGMLGSMAGNLALLLGALGGVYLGGGVALKMGPLFDRSYFRQRFEDKGRLSSFLRPIPCFQITAQYPAFLGVSAILREQLEDAQAKQ